MTLDPFLVKFVSGFAVGGAITRNLLVSSHSTRALSLQ